MIGRLSPVLFFLFLSCSLLFSQAPIFAAKPTGPQSVPRLIKFSGALRQSNGSAFPNTASAVFAIYGESEGGTPLWKEAQEVVLDSSGKYAVLLGATNTDGILQELFSTGEARWLGVQVEGYPEQPRTLLVSVPYALKAADADTLGGKPLSAFVLSDAALNDDSKGAANATPSGLSASANRLPVVSCAPGAGGCTKPASVLNPTVNQISKFSAVPGELVNSAMVESGGNVVINGTASSGTLTVGGSNVHQIAAVGPQGSNVISAYVQGTTKRASMFINTAGIGVFESYQDGVGPVNFAVNPAGGNVGIGTSAPGFPLTVQGGAGPQKIAAIGPAGANVISSYVAGTNQRASMFINTAGIGVFEAYNDGVGPLNFAVNPASGSIPPLRARLWT